MGVEIPIGYGQASFVFNLSGKTGDIVWTLGFKQAGSLTGVNEAGLIRAAWSSAGKPFVAAQMGDQWTFAGVRATTMSGTGPVLKESMSGVTGTNTLGSVPPNCAFLVRKQTERGGRKGRGRAYFPPLVPGETFVSSTGILDAVSVSATNGYIAAAIAQMVTSEVPPYLLHEDGSEPDLITGMVMQTMVATQRRRLR